MHITLKVWRQKNGQAEGRFETYEANDVSSHMSFLEMLDVVNEDLIRRGDDPIAFDSDCREGICGACGFVINGVAHGPNKATTVCQLHMRFFKDGDMLTLEPWRAAAFPIMKDLTVDRSALDGIVQAGGFISIGAGGAPEANWCPCPRTTPTEPSMPRRAFGCGACVAACPNASAMLFTAAKVSHLGLLPQGQPERWRRVRDMVARHDAEGFGHCSNHGECEAVCPKSIPINFIAFLNRDLRKSVVRT